jgi:hypothetical protein
MVELPSLPRMDLLWRQQADAAVVVAVWKPACNFDPLTGEIGVQN